VAEWTQSFKDLYFQFLLNPKHLFYFISKTFTVLFLYFDFKSSQVQSPSDEQADKENSSFPIAIMNSYTKAFKFSLETNGKVILISTEIDIKYSIINIDGKEENVEENEEILLPEQASQNIYDFQL
jgi:hypothetical protein